MDLLDIFRAHLPHLADKAAQAAPEICDFEALLDEAADTGLKPDAVGWLAWRETFVIAAEATADAWINVFSAHGYRAAGASWSNALGSVTAHFKHADGRRMALVMQAQQVAA